MKLTLWPRSLLYRLIVMTVLGLLLANALTLSLLLYERMGSARKVMMSNLEYDVATSVAILDRLPATERPQWLKKLARGNYSYQLNAGENGEWPDSWRTRPAVRSLQQTLGGHYPLSIVSLPGDRPHIQAHLQLHDGTPLTVDLWPKMPAIAWWLPITVLIQLALLLTCSWFAVRQVVKPFTRFTDAVNSLEPGTQSKVTLNNHGPEEVMQATAAFNAMQLRIDNYLKERAQILAAISHDLQTPITRMKLRVEMAEQPALRDKLVEDLDNMTRLVREGIALARASQTLEEPRQWMSITAFVDVLCCDYADVGHPVTFSVNGTDHPFMLQPQALRRIMTNLIDNALKFGEVAQVTLDLPATGEALISVADNGPGIPELELEAVLQPFYRGESSRNRDTGGTGLGLAIAAQLSAQMAGKLRLRNRAEGGLEVQLRLPPPQSSS